MRIMGWREGQGVGPLKSKKVDLNDTEICPYHEGYKYAPSASQLITIERKKDKFGLGYNGIKSQSLRINENQDERKTNTGEPLGMRGGIGVGVLNEDGEDESDHYASYTPRGGYDASIGPKLKQKKPAASHSVLFRPREKINEKTIQNASKHTFISQKKTAYNSLPHPFKSSSKILRKCHDGRLPLTGFSLAKREVNLQSDWFDPPEIPEGYIPSTNFSENFHRKVRTDQPLMPDDRGDILEEDKIPERQGLEKAESEDDSLPSIEAHSAYLALNGGFMPYGEDLPKRERYKMYLEAQAGVTKEPLIPPEEIKRSQWRNELAEFALAAQIFKPMGRMMASRFTSSTDVSTQQTSVVDGYDTGITAKKEKEQEPALLAAQMNMFGHLTRTISEFYPAKLLCKRFGVNPPTNMGSVELAYSGYSETAPASAHGKPSTNNRVGQGEVHGVVQGGKNDENSIFAKSNLVEIHSDINLALEKERPEDDLFAAIFGD